MKGLDLLCGSAISDFLRFIEVALVESSMYLSCIVLLPLNGRGTGGRRQAPLNLTMKRRPPSNVPAPYPPGRHLDEDLAVP